MEKVSTASWLGSEFVRKKRPLIRQARAWAVLFLVLATPLIAPGGVLGNAIARSNGVAARQPFPSLHAIDRRSAHPPAGEFRRLATIARRHGSVRAIAGLRVTFTPEGLLDGAHQQAQRDAIAQARTQLLSALSGTRFSILRTYIELPYVALQLSSAALSSLRSSGRAATLAQDLPDKPLLDVSTRIVEATETASLGRTGKSQTVAVLDTGVDKTHPFLQQAAGGPSKVVAEACYSDNANCPSGQKTDTSTGSGVPCQYDPTECDHGTHVAGIATGNGAAAGVTFSGVAPGATLISIQVFSKTSEGTSSFPSDQMAALQHVYDLRTDFSIAAVNMSLGGGVTGSGYCDDDPLKPAIDNLLSVGIPTVIAAGNDGSNVGVGHPACISTAVTVGATTDADTLATFSNSSNVVDLLAPGGADPGGDDPGTGIFSSVPVSMDNEGPADGFENKSGTSQATPHVAGAFAVLRGVNPTADPYTLLYYLQVTGKPITESLSNVTKPRIRVLSASVMLGDTGFKKGPSFTYQGGAVATVGIGFAQRAGAATSNEVAMTIPVGATVQHAYLYWMTIGGPDTKVLFCDVVDTTKTCTRPAGTLLGASSDTGWNVNQSGPIRTYRGLVPTGLITVGTGTYEISNVGRRSNGADGEGASLVVLYTQPSNKTGKIVIRNGAITATSGETISDSFSGLSVPSAPARVNLAVGFGDGESGASATEDPLLFQGSPITPSNAFFGADGPMWDAKYLGVSTGLLPAGTTSRRVSIHTISDSLAWGYSILTYQY